MKINELDFEELKGNKKNIYTHLWNKSDLDFEVQRIGKSDFSYQFEINNDIINQIGSGMANVFALNERELFLEKFRQACSGNGNEISKITTLHSSSLCSLLFFYAFGWLGRFLQILPGQQRYFLTGRYSESPGALRLLW